MYTVDVDTGGTMTDGLIADGARLHAIKVDTTPHDYTVSFRQVLVEGARATGHGDDLGGFLDQVSVIRWSSTITSNALGEGRGAKVGLLVRAGHEKDLYGPGDSPAVGILVAPHNVIGLPEHPEITDVLGAVKRLFEDGVRRVCISLEGAFPDNTAERQLAAVIEGQYPDHFLGAVPVLLGSEMAQVDDTATRTNFSLINAFTHTRLASSLFQAEDMLKYDEGWKGALLVGHINGGVAGIGKTKAVDTIESGPVFGTFAAAWLARRHGLSDVLCLDVGGTTAKASVVRDGQPVFTRDGDIFGLPVKAQLPLLRSTVLGGGSVARADGGEVTLGPDSMGAAPGPACYGLGGTEATVTDAFVVLGWLDPERFLSGRRALDRAKAEEAINRQLAGPLGCSVDEAARRVAHQAVDVVAALVASTLAKAGLDARDVTLFAYGGNGALLAAPVAKRLGLSEARVFGLGPVLAAFGSAVSDVVHVYERSVGADVASPTVRVAAERLLDSAVRDLEAEGFGPAGATFELELDMAGASPGVFRAPVAPGEGAVAAALAGASGRADVVRARSRYPVGAFEPTARPPGGGGGELTPVAHRPVRFGLDVTEAPVYDWDGLGAGARVAGPAVVAGGSMTCLVLPGWTLEVDELGDGVLRTEGA